MLIGALEVADRIKIKADATDFAIKGRLYEAHNLDARDAATQGTQ